MYSIQLLSMVMFIFVGAISIGIIVKAYDEKNDQTAQNLLFSTGQNIDLIIENLYTSIHNFCYTESVQQVFAGDSANSSMVMSSNKVMESFYFMKRIQAFITDITFMRIDKTVFSLTSDMDLAMLKKVG